MQIKTRGIVFRSVKYGESSVIADIFTEEKGLHTFIAGGGAYLALTHAV